jgi:hypothetical protein
MAVCPAPTMGLQALMGGGTDRLSGIDLIGNLATAMAPVMEQLGIVTGAELRSETLIDGMQHEVTDKASVVVGCYEVGARSRLPSRGASG